MWGEGSKLFKAPHKQILYVLVDLRNGTTIL
jgi:hypothetical protein